MPKSRISKAKATKNQNQQQMQHPRVKVDPSSLPKDRSEVSKGAVGPLLPPGRRKTKRSCKESVQENVIPEVEAVDAVATKSSASEQMEVRRPLSVVDPNLVGSRGSTGDLDDSVFGEVPKSLLGSIASSLHKHKRSLSRGGSVTVEEGGQGKPRPSPPSSAIVVSGPPNGTLPFHANSPDAAVPEGVVDIDLEEDGMLEYGADMYLYLMWREEQFTVMPNYLDHSSVSPDMRAVLVDWIIQVQHYLKLSQETLYISISLLDSILDRRDVEPDKLQLVGITVLYLGSKMEEYYPADIKKLLHLTEDSYTVKEVFNMELVILGVVDFQVYVPTPVDFLGRLCRAALRSSSKSFLDTCYYLTDCHLPCPSHPTISPSHLAAAAVLAASLLYYTQVNPGVVETGLEHLWTPTLQYYSGYTGSQVLPTAITMLSQLATTKLGGARTKYQSRSQHGRLAMAPHFAINVVTQALFFLRNIDCENREV